MSAEKRQHKSLCSGPAIPPLDTYSPKLKHETLPNCEDVHHSIVCYWKQPRCPLSG